MNFKFIFTTYCTLECGRVHNTVHAAWRTGTIRQTTMQFALMLLSKVHHKMKEGKAFSLETSTFGPHVQESSYDFQRMPHASEQATGGNVRCSNVGVVAHSMRIYEASSSTIPWRRCITLPAITVGKAAHLSDNKFMLFKSTWKCKPAE